MLTYFTGFGCITHQHGRGGIILERCQEHGRCDFRIAVPDLVVEDHKIKQIDITVRAKRDITRDYSRSSLTYTCRFPLIVLRYTLRAVWKQHFDLTCALEKHDRNKREALPGSHYLPSLHGSLHMDLWHPPPTVDKISRHQYGGLSCLISRSQSSNPSRISGTRSFSPHRSSSSNNVCAHDGCAHSNDVHS